MISRQLELKSVDCGGVPFVGLIEIFFKDLHLGGIKDVEEVLN